MGKCEFLNHSIIAHRGIYNNITIYENTIESIMYAIKNNLSVSIEVRLTQDKELIVFNDEEMKRLIKLKDKINSITKEELDYISPYHIPTLKEVINMINNKVPIIINVKEDNKIIRNEIIKLINNYKGNIAIQSSILEATKYYKKKNLITGLIIDENLNEVYLDKDIDVDFLTIKYNLIDKVKSNILKKKYYLIGHTLETREDVEFYIKMFNNLIIDNIEEVFQ